MVIFVAGFFLNFFGNYNSQLGKCDGLYKGCCVGTVWNTEQQKCIECLPGYFGLNCTEECPLPYFGKMCMGTCNCSNHECDRVFGCPQDSPKRIGTTVFKSHLTTPYLVNTDMQNETNSHMMHEISKNESQFEYFQLKMAVIIIITLAVLVVVMICGIRLRKRFTAIHTNMTKGKSVYDDLAAFNDTERLYDALGPERIYEGSGHMSVLYSCHDKTFTVKMKTSASAIDSRIINAMLTQHTQPNSGCTDHGQPILSKKSHHESTSTIKHEDNEEIVEVDIL